MILLSDDLAPETTQGDNTDYVGKNPHYQRKYKTVIHKHPKRTTQTTEIEYDGVKEIIQITAEAKPVESIKEIKKEKNPEKIHIAWIGELEIFIYEKQREIFFVGASNSCYPVPIRFWRELMAASTRLRTFDSSYKLKKAKSGRYRRKTS